MKAKYKEDPRAWRKSTLLSVLGLLVVSSLLRWRNVLSTLVWGVFFVMLVLVGILACVRPRWFRGYYRFSTWAGFWSSQVVARSALALIFAVAFAPAGILLRLCGKDPLALKRPSDPATYWRKAPQEGSLDRSF